ncbi:MAG: glycosyltransferase family 4 protein [Hydrogenophaga sp.]|nr:glycosyltransferase family 4 protein [Hydrogenophaga sp.]
MAARPRPTARRLLILASLPALRNAQGQWLLPAKFVSGLKTYARHWPGPVVVGLQAGDQPTADLDNRFWSPGELPFELHTVSFPELAGRGSPLLEGAVVMVTLNHLLYGLGRRCLEQGAALVVNTELSLSTQLQIARATHGWGLRLIKSAVWLLLNHRRAVREIRSAQGLQCNGTPTFDTLARHSPSPLLYFDNRTTWDRCASAADLDARFAALSSRRRLRLLFSGRLHPIKGVQGLVPLASLLRAQGTPFELWIAGDGPLRASMQAGIVEQGLQDQVRLLGTLDFERDIQPMLREEIDLFVCPHLQGDPSCTYLETLCAGVPIVGYPNEAWRGLHRLSSAGRLCASARPEAMAREIGALAGDTAALRQLADRALAFATQHVFDAEFSRRINHLKQLGNLQDAPT